MSATAAARHSPDDLATWRTDGAVVLRGLLRPDEIAPVRADYDALYGDRLPAPGAPARVDEGPPSSRPEQFAGTDDIPVECSPALNLLGLHPALIAFARDALGVDDVRMYQCHTWAKFTGDADYAQGHHYDFMNHTLTVPADDAALGTVNFIVYVTDVTDALGATHYVPRPASDELGGAGRPYGPRWDEEFQTRLRAVERSAAAPSGSVLAYGIDTYHRGTNLTAPGGHRYTLTASYKAAGNDMIGFNAFQRSFRQPWHLVIEHATPEQLACLGVPPPGHPFWTERTLARTEERWPGWDSSPYRAAMTAT